MSKNRRFRERRVLLEQLATEWDISAPSWNRAEADILSAQIESKVKRKLFSRIIRGRLQTIYGESFIEFAGRTYSRSQYIVVLKFEKGDLTIMGLGRRAFLYDGENLIGEFHEGRLKSGRQLIGKISRSKDGMARIYEINDEDVARRRLLNRDSVVTDRFFEMVMTNKIGESDFMTFSGILGYDVISRLIEEMYA